MHVESGCALWAFFQDLKKLDFKLCRHFNIAVLATKTALKRQWTLSITLMNPKKHDYWSSLILKQKQTALWGRRASESNQYFLFCWMRSSGNAQAKDMLASVLTCSFHFRHNWGIKFWGCLLLSKLPVNTNFSDFNVSTHHLTHTEY